MRAIGKILRGAALWLLTVMAVAMTGCSTNPATGDRAFTLMSQEDEAALGRSQHPKILEEFGGAYEDADLQAYVDGIGRRLVAGAGVTGTRYTFTVLDSPIVNAFAVPGGYVYVTRGLLALANDEAELAGVIGHEIGHVAARHGAQRHGRSVLVGLGAGILGALSGNSGVSEILNLGAGLYLKGYSRDQEFEPDSIGLRYLAQAGYDADAMAGFLETLGAQSRLEARLMGSGTDPDAYSILSTHPRTVDRVEEARTEALGAAASGGRRARDAYLDRIDGLLFGDDPQQGFVRGRRFAHPILRFEFTVPPGFTLINGQRSVRARGPDGAAIIFDMARSARQPIERYLTEEWGAELPLVDLSRIEVSGLEGATAQTRVTSRDSGATIDLRLVALRQGDQVFRILFATRAADTHRFSEELRRTTYSFRLLDDHEVRQLKPYRVRTHQVAPGDTVAALSQWMPDGPEPEARFRVLNGLVPGAEPSPGQRIKFIGY